MKTSLFILSLMLVFSYAQTPAILPAEAILLNPLEISDLTATSASLQLSTTIDVACLVVFGEDDGFGNIALDQDMGANAHQNHSIIMRGLKPDTNYLYRLQGSDTSGNFYASEIMSFRTPIAEVGLNLGTNLASVSLGASIINVSSNFGGGKMTVSGVLIMPLMVT